MCFGQIAIGTNDVYKTAEAIKLYGGKIIREPGPLPGINTKIVACLDPDGWKSVWLIVPFARMLLDVWYDALIGDFGDLKQIHLTQFIVQLFHE